MRDAHNALLCSVIANTVGAAKAAIVSALAGLAGKKRNVRAKKYKPKDFLLIRPPRTKKSGKQMLALVELLNAAFGGEDLRKKVE